MRLFAALQPPPEVLEHLVSAVQQVSAPSPRKDTAGGPSHRGPSARGWRLRRDRPDLSGDAPAGARLATPEIARMLIPVTYFGNLTQGDAVELAAALRRTVLTLAAPELRFAGGTGPEEPGDETVWASVQGDIEGLRLVGHTVTDAARTLGLFVDRRVLRPRIAVGTVPPGIADDYVTSLVDALASYSGPPWRQGDLTLLRGQPEDETALVVSEQMPLG